MTILDRILDATRDEVARRKREASVSELASLAHARPAGLFEARLREPGLSFICEAKHRSPSKGVLRDPYNPVEIARGYAKAGAAAMSVLTEPFFFSGDPAHLQAIRAAEPDLVLLRKDFIVDAYQLHEARAWGADAILLIAAALDASLLRELQEAARDLGLSVLLELHDAEEAEKANLDLHPVVGVNNRDLRTFEVDVQRSLRVFATLPPHLIRVAESGLKDAETLVHLAQNGVDAVLMGETFMRAADPGLALSSLRAEIEALLSAHPDPNVQ